VESRYQAQRIPAEILGAKMTKDSKYMVVHLLKSHLFSVSKRQNHEFVVVRCMGKRLNTMKVNLDFPAGTKIYFEVTNEIPLFDLPYLYILKDSKLII
jgi:hypothetical protein